MHFTVYRITNMVNGKIYIGKHKTLNLNDGYMGSGKLIIAAIKKYGMENFKKEILFDFLTEEEMNRKEAELVFIGESSYNLVFGGTGGFGYINSTGKNIYENHSQISRTNIKKARTVLTDMLSSNNEFREIFSSQVSDGLKEYYEENDSHWNGRKHSEETKRKISEKRKGTQTGHENGQFGTKWLTNGVVNKKVKKSDVNKWLTEGYWLGRTL